MSEEEIKKILEDPKKTLDLIILGHRLLHAYEAQEIKKKMDLGSNSKETIGLSDELEIKVIHPK